MITAEIIIDARYKSKKGYPLKIRVYCDIVGKHKYISLKKYQYGPDIVFDSELRKRVSKLDEEIKFCNDNLYQLDQAKELFEEGIPLDDLDIEIELLEKRLELLRHKKGLKNNIGFIQFTNTLIKERQVLKIPTESYVSARNAVKRVIGDIEDIPINNITNEWIKGFDLFYKDLKKQDSSIKTYLTVIKSIYTEAQSRESLNIKKDDPFIKLRNFKRNKKESQLDISDLRSMYAMDIADIKTSSKFGPERIKQVMDIFLFQYAIGGHDLIDVANLKWTNIKDGRIVFKRYKNRFKKYEGEEVNNMLSDFALLVIEKYGDRKSKRIFSFIPDPTEDMIKYKYYMNTLNLTTFGIIKKLIGSNNDFTTKSTRYLFRTAAGNLLIDSLILMKIQGHTPQGVTFGYQGAINYEVQDKEHQKVLDLVFK